MRFNVGFATDIGLRRSQNQDSGASLPEIGLFVVADGMGGHRGGEIASQMASQIICDSVRESLARTEDPSPPSARAMLTVAIQKANQEIFDRSLKENDLQGMGTTATVLLFQSSRMTIGHVGDSRAYFVRDRAIWQLTRDHSLVQEKLRAGLITREQARTDLMRNVITRSVGFGHETVAELYEMEAAPGDVFLICSDGLSGAVEDAEILEVVEKRVTRGSDPQNAVSDLILFANARGGHDNTTVIAIQVTD